MGFAWDAKFGLLLVKQRRVFLNYIEYDSEKIHVPVHKHMKCRNHRFTMKEFVIREQSARMYVRGPLSQTIQGTAVIVMLEAFFYFQLFVQRIKQYQKQIHVHIVH